MSKNIIETIGQELFVEVKWFANFEKINDNVFVAGCYNGSGIGTGTFWRTNSFNGFKSRSDKISIIENRIKPTMLPVNILLNIVYFAYVMRDL